MTATLPDGRAILWQPHAGPQTTFLQSTAYEALYGGAAGGGKSDALLMESLRQTDHPSYRALLLRRTFPELQYLMDRAASIFRPLGATWNEQAKRFRWPSGAIIEFGYAEHYRDVLQYQGDAFQYVGWDELGHIAEERIWTYLISRNRPVADGQRCYMRASANPGGPGHAWIKRRFVDMCDPSGVPVVVDGFTRAFVAARLADNPTLMANDPEYGQRLNLLPELERRWLRDGDWTAGAGLAFSVRKDRHLVPAFDVPVHWTLFSALDWGYNHPFSWGLYAANEDGRIWCVDTVSGRHLQPPDIADRFKSILHGRTLRYSVAGHDVWADVRARSERIPTLAEQFAGEGLPMTKANISRIAGVQNCRRYLEPITDDGPPRFAWMDTPENRKVFECIETRVADPDHPEDVLKLDADDAGQGGDDHYDQWRYALASRPLPARLPKVAQDKLEDRSPRRDWTKEGVPAKIVKPDAELDRLLARDQRRADRTTNPNRVRPRKW